MIEAEWGQKALRTNNFIGFKFSVSVPYFSPKKIIHFSFNHNLNQLNPFVTRTKGFFKETYIADIKGSLLHRFDCMTITSFNNWYSSAAIDLSIQIQLRIQLNPCVCKRLWEWENDENDECRLDQLRTLCA